MPKSDDASHPESCFFVCLFGEFSEFLLLMSSESQKEVSAVSEGVWCVSTSSSACSPLSLVRGKFGRCLDMLMPYQA